MPKPAPATRETLGMWEDPGDTGEFVYSLPVGGAISPS